MWTLHHTYVTLIYSSIMSRDHNDREYERLRTFLDEHHNKEWRIAVAAKLKHVVQGRHHAHVCKQNASHEEEWRNSIRAIQARAFHFGV